MNFYNRENTIGKKEREGGRGGGGKHFTLGSKHPNPKFMFIFNYNIVHNILSSSIPNFNPKLMQRF
jgi:hypothetical protein